MKYIQYRSFYTQNLLLTEQKSAKTRPVLLKDKSKNCRVSHARCPSSLRCWVVLVTLASILAGGAFLGFDPFVKWILLKKSVLRNDTAVYHAWKSPPISPHLKVFMFNLTNAAQVFAGKEKPKLEEIGPYTYRQKWSKQNVTWNHNGTVTFKNRKMFRFSAEDSCDTCDDKADKVTTLNILLISAYHQLKDSILAWGFNLVQTRDPWMTVSPAELLWGYEDSLYDLSQWLPGTTPPFDKFGIFAAKNVSTEELIPSITMLTGETDPYKVSSITRLNGKTHLTHWNTEQCNRIHGSSGAGFGPFKKKNETIWLFDKQICRAIPFTFSHNISHQGLTGLRFEPREDVFMSKSFPAENLCFNDSQREFGDGVYDISPCQYNAPIVLSWPHFLHAENKYQSGIVGLTPDKQKHKTYFDVEPVSGSTMRAKARMQINMAIRKTETFTHLQYINDTLIPILWFEEGIDGLSEEILKMIRSVTVEIEIYKKVLLVAFLLLCSMDCILILLISGKLIKRKIEAAKLKSIFNHLSLVLPGHPRSTEPRLLAYTDSTGSSLISSAQASHCHSRNSSNVTANVDIY